MRCKADVLYLKRVLPLFLLLPLAGSFAPDWTETLGVFDSGCMVKTPGSICKIEPALDKINQEDFPFIFPFLCVLRALCGELCISTIQSGSYLAWQFGQMRMILQVSFVNRTNEVWNPSSYPQFGQIWSSFSIFIETGFGVLFSNYLFLVTI